MITKKHRDGDLPEESVELIKLAMQYNVTKEEFKAFLEEKSKIKNQKSMIEKFRKKRSE